MAEIRKGEEFAAGFLGALSQEGGLLGPKKQLTPAEQMKLMEMESEGQLQKAPFANDPQRAIKFITSLLPGLQGDPMSQYQANKRPGMDFRPAIIEKAPALKDVLTRPITKPGDATNLVQTFADKSRAPYYSLLGFDESDGAPVTFDAASKQFFKGEKAIGANELGRVLSKTKPQLDSTQINEITNLLNSKTQLEGVKALFDPSATGPIESRLQDFTVSTGITLPGLKQIMEIKDDRVRLSTLLASSVNDYVKAVTGAQMSEPEARRILKAFPKKAGADEAFVPTLNEVIDVIDNKLENRLGVLESQGTVGMDKIRELAKRGKPRTHQPSNVPQKKSLGEIFK